RRAVNNTIKYIPHHYYKNHLSDLQEILKNPNLRSVWVAANSENNDAAFWSKVSQLGLIHFFSLLSESSREYEIFKKAFSGLSIQRIRQIRKTDSSVVTNPDLILDNFMKFAELVSSINWNGPIIDLNYITGSTLPHDETTISSIDDIHPKINYILQNDAVATQVRAIALKVPIGKIPPMIVAMLPTKGDESADQISNLLREVIELANVANLNILSFGSDGARSEFNAQSIIMNEASESTVIAFNEAMSLANYLHIKHNEYTIPPIITSTENMNNAFSEDNGDQYCEINVESVITIMGPFQLILETSSANFIKLSNIKSGVS
ncbi:2257_t:CDS:2, partial [Entrophospora sp. SA101]